MKKSNIKPLALAISAALAASAGSSSMAHADTSPFSMTNLATGYMVDANNPEAAAEKGEEGKCGEGKCGEGKCGEKKGEEGKCGGEKAGEAKGEEGKCGEGKCGGLA